MWDGSSHGDTSTLARVITDRVIDSGSAIDSETPGSTNNDDSARSTKNKNVAGVVMMSELFPGSSSDSSTRFHQIKLSGLFCRFCPVHFLSGNFRHKPVGSVGWQKLL